MATRRNIGGRYVEVRERSTSKGKRGTIMKNWKNKKTNKVEKISNTQLFTTIILIIIIILIIYYFLF